MITKEELDQRKVRCEDDRTVALLPYTDLCIEEFDIIHEMLPGLNERRLTVSIGKGISYTLSASSKENFIDAYLSSQDSFFALPMTITLVARHLPQGRHEHSDWCAYSWEQWPEDEQGNTYWAEPEYMEYDEETEKLSAEEKYRIDCPDCYCESIEDASQEFEIKEGTPDELAPITAWLEENWR